MGNNVPQQSPARLRNRLEPLAMIAVFDIAGPLVTYSIVRSAGLGTVPALLLSGVFPALGVLLSFARRRRMDAVGALVLAGVAVGTILGLISGNERLILAEGSVPTAIFGLACLGSLWASRPLIFRFALEFIGADTVPGRDFVAKWQYAGFRHVFRLFTLVWGAAYLAEAAARVVIIELASTGTALLVSKIMPYVVAALLIGWTNCTASGPGAVASSWPPFSTAPIPAGPRNCRMWPRNPPSAAARRCTLTATPQHELGAASPRTVTDLRVSSRPSRLWPRSR